MRLGVRRWFALRKRRRVQDLWPIFEPAGTPPAGWPGWPDGRRFAFVVTHDVEGQVGLDRVRQLAEVEKELGFRSSFNFIPEGEYETPPRLRQWLGDEGFEVGVHDLNHDGKLYESRESFGAKAAGINRYLKEWNAVGFRSGFMHHNYEWLQELDVLYDASSFDTDPFEPQPDGVQTIFPFWMGGPDGHGYIELPYTLAQDSTLFLLMREQSIEVWRRKLDWIVERGGMALVNVHPDYVGFGPRSAGFSEYTSALYRELLTYVRDRYAGQYWHALPREVARFATGLHHRPGRYTAPARGSGRPGDYRPVRLAGRRAAVVMFSTFPFDPRPRRAAEALVQEGVHTEIICLRQDEAEPKREVVHGVRVFRVPMKRRRGGKFSYAWQYASFIAISAFILAVRRLRRRYDLVHVHNMPDVLVLSALIPKLLGARVVLDLHDPMPELMMTIFGLRKDSRTVRFLEQVERGSMLVADRVLTVNLACKKIFGARSCPLPKIEVIMNSPDEAIFGFRGPRPGRELAPSAAGQGQGARPFVIMCHGSIVERHGHDVAVEAMRLIAPKIPTAELRIYGHRTPFLDRVLQSAAEAGLEQRVRYFGGVNLEAVVRAIDEADVGIIPNRRSIFTELNTPTRIFEYLARGLPVIAPRAPGIQDYFREDEIIFFQLGDAVSLADRIRFVHANPEAVREIVERGQAIYRSHLWREERGRLIQLMDELIAPSGRP
jgi:glycosyltransferase involved in cell wall biosynthesis